MQAHDAPPEQAAPSPLRLSATDFDAYALERATSHAFTRPRLELKQRMLAWARHVASRLSQMGIALETAGSDEHPSLRNGHRVTSQEVFFWRDQAARSELDRLIEEKRSLASRLGDPAPHRGHAHLALSIDRERVSVGLALFREAWVDVRNVEARLSDPERTIELGMQFEALPEQFGLGVLGKTIHPRPGTDTLRSVLAEAANEGAVWLGWSLDRETALLHTELLDEQLADALVALGPVYKLLAWSRDNDCLVLAREVDVANKERERAHAEAEEDRRAFEEKREKRARVRERERDATQADDVPPSEPHSLTPERDHRVPVVPKRPGFRTTGRRSVPGPLVFGVIEKGVRVEVTEGPFAGKTGVVQDTDPRGTARVMLGLLAVRIDTKDLVLSGDGKEKIQFSSSHRKLKG